MNISGNTKGGDRTPKTPAAEKPAATRKKDIKQADAKINSPKAKNPAKQREQSEQPVHPIKKSPKE